MDTSLQGGKNSGKEDELTSGVSWRHEQCCRGAEKMPCGSSRNSQSQETGAGKSTDVLAGFGVAIDCHRSPRSAGKLEEGGEHGLQDSLRLVPELLGLESLQHVQEGLQSTFADAWMGGLRLSDHVKDGTETKSNNARQVRLGVV